MTTASSFGLEDFHCKTIVDQATVSETEMRISALEVPVSVKMESVNAEHWNVQENEFSILCFTCTGLVESP